MKFEITKKHLVKALVSMSEIATKGIKSEFEEAGRITIDAQSKKVVFLSTNGHAFATFDITKETDAALKIEEEGKATVSAVIILATCRAIAGRSEDHIFGFHTDGKGPLVIKDLDTEKSKRRKSQVELQVFDEHHNFQVSKPRSGFTYRFPTDVLTKAINTISKYRPVAAYRIEYEMICIHFLKDEIRFVCGNGSRFSIYCISLDTKDGDGNGMPSIPDLDEDGKKCILPVDQAAIMLRMLNDAEHVSITYRDDTNVHVNPENGVSMDIKGIPHVSYIAYEKHAYRTKQAKAIVDIQTSDLEEGAAVIWSVRDKEIEAEGCYHSYTFDSKEGQVYLFVSEQKYNAEWSAPANYYKVESDGFVGHYAARVLKEMFAAAVSEEKEYVRFYCINEITVMIAEAVNLNENKKDEHGVPEIMRADNEPRLFFFYASAKEPDGNG